MSVNTGSGVTVDVIAYSWTSATALDGVRRRRIVRG